MWLLTFSSGTFCLKASPFFPLACHDGSDYVSYLFAQAVSKEVSAYTLLSHLGVSND
jgi:hypothetical protein